MDLNVESESGAQAAADNEVSTIDTSEFQKSTSRLDELMTSMGVLLSDVEQLRSHCSNQASELLQAAKDLRQQQEELKQSYVDLGKEMQEIMESMEDLFNTKSAFETKEKQTQKLNRQL
ncbi:uncharacterized protein V6R79_004332 [Siganus canaliculatus]